jgi:hypothetical protein
VVVLPPPYGKSTALSQLTKLIPSLQRDRRHHLAWHHIINRITVHMDLHNDNNDDNNH